MPEMNVTQEDLKQAEALEKALPVSIAKGVDICGAWNSIKKFWPWIIKIVRFIPSVGGAIAKALEFLGGALDTFCQAG